MYADNESFISSQNIGSLPSVDCQIPISANFFYLLCASHRVKAKIQIDTGHLAIGNVLNGSPTPAASVKEATPTTVTTLANIWLSS
jgi:hypothetical protein